MIGKSFPASDRCTLGSIWFPSSKKWLSSGLQRSGGWAQDSDSGPKEFWVPVKMKSFRTSAAARPDSGERNRRGRTGKKTKRHEGSEEQSSLKPRARGRVRAASLESRAVAMATDHYGFLAAATAAGEQLQSRRRARARAALGDDRPLRSSLKAAYLGHGLQGVLLSLCQGAKPAFYSFCWFPRAHSSCSVTWLWGEGLSSSASPPPVHVNKPPSASGSTTAEWKALTRL